MWRIQATSYRIDGLRGRSLIWSMWICDLRSQESPLGGNQTTVIHRALGERKGFDKW